MKRALITGSTKGIGRAIGIELLFRGCMVVFNYSQDTAGANQLCMELDRLGYSGQYQIIKADLSEIEGIHMLLDGLDSHFPSFDYLVLNAGITQRGPLEEITPAVWEHVLRTNLTVPLFLTQACTRYLNENGSILFIGAIMGQYPHALSIPYGTSKAALHYLSRILVKEFAPKNIRVNCLCPGFVETPLQRNKPAAIRKSIEGKIALHRFAVPEEVAQMAVSILENTYTNGAVVNIDGGYCYQ